jgi:hypothetical protein
MNKPLAFLGLLAASSCTAQAVERADGTLGTNHIAVRGVYMNADMGEYVSGLDLDFSGVGFDINQNLYKDGDIGIDASFSYSYMTNQNFTNLYSADNHSYTLGTTVYREGVISPYFTLSGTHDSLKFNYKQAAGTDWDDDTFIVGGEIGAECHFMPGWSVTPYVLTGVDVDADDDAWTTAVGVSSVFWINSRIGVKGGVAYTNKMDMDVFVTHIGMALHY